MTAIALYCGLVLASSTATTPKDLTVEVRMCKGDPLGSRESGNVRYLVESSSATQLGKPVEVRAGGEVPYLDGKKTEYRFVGTLIQVIPLPQPNGHLWTEVNLTHSNHTTISSGKKGVTTTGFSEQTCRCTAVTKLGETLKVRISANDPNDQVWVDVTIRAAGAVK